METSDTTPSIATSTDAMPKGVPALKMEQRTDKACRAPAAKTLTAAFSTDPVLRWLLSPSTSDPQSESLISNASCRNAFFVNGVLSLALSGGGTIINPDGEWNSCGILVPPGHNTESFTVYLKCWPRLVSGALKLGFGATWKAMVTYPKTPAFLRHTVFPPSRSDHLKRLRIYYIFFLGSLPSARSRGLGGAFITHCQAKASADGLPIYLECSADRSRLFYERMGFKSVCVVRCGKGAVDEEGYMVDVKRDGIERASGVKIWAMIWWPEGMWPEGVEYWDGKSEMEVK